MGPGRSQGEGPRRNQPLTPGSQTAAQSCDGYISIVHTTICGVCRGDQSRRRQWPGHSTVEGTTSRRGPGLTKPGQLAGPSLHLRGEPGRGRGRGPRAWSRPPGRGRAQPTTQLGLREESGTVFFTVLLEKLIQIGLCLSTPSWPETWRKDHKQSALINDRVLSCEEVSSGEPWGPRLI